MPDLDRLEALAKKATPAPWAIDGLWWDSFVAELVNAAEWLFEQARAAGRVRAALDLLESDLPGEMLVLPPEHHTCEQQITRLTAQALRRALEGAPDA